MGQDNEDALDQVYRAGLDDGREEMEREMMDQIDEARKEGYDEGFADALSNAVAAVRSLE